MTCVTRGKVSVNFVTKVGLRDVLLPSERMPINQSACSTKLIGVVFTIGDERLLVNLQSRLVKWNRERELGLDRRETG